MKKMFLLFNHTPTDAQKRDANLSLRVDEFVSMPDELQQLWSNVPSELANLGEYLQPIKAYLQIHLTPKDIVLIQGDFGASHMMANLVKSIGAVPVYATTSRDVIEELDGDKVIKKSIFKHERFREYE